MKKLLIILLFVISIKGFSQSSFHNLKIKDISGNQLDIAGFSGKKILVVNSASAGPRADQFSKLKILANRYKDSGLIILVFPSNDFNNEPKSNNELKALGSSTNFLICEKISVKGSSISPIYKWLTQKASNNVADMPVKDDFQKFIINDDGKLVGVFSGKVSPLNLPVLALKN